MSVFHNCTGLPRQLFSHLENQCFHDLWPLSSCWVSLLQVVPWMETKQIYNSKEARVNVFNKIMLLKGTVKQIISKFQLVLENLRDMMKPYVCVPCPPPQPTPMFLTSNWRARRGANLDLHTSSWQLQRNRSRSLLNTQGAVWCFG